MKLLQSREFELAQKDQSASKLLQLPAEIRLRILRLLLKHDGKLPTRTSAIAGGSERASLSSQILGTCQSIYQEAYYVLYYENVASIRIGSTSTPRRTLDLELLDACAYFFGLVPESHHASICKEPYTQRHYVNLRTRTLVEALSTLARFARISITFLQSDDYMVVSRCLRRPLLDKCVTVDFGSWRSVGSATSNEPCIKPDHPRFSPACFGVWKCKSIEFRNGCRLDCCEARYAELANLITDSTIQVRDLLPDMWRLNDVLSLLPDLRPFFHGTDLLFERNRSTLLHALYNNDTPVFKQATRQLMEQARQALIGVQIVQKREIEISVMHDLYVMDQEFPEHEDGNDSWRTIWSDHIFRREEEQIASLEQEISDKWKLMTQLLDEDDLLNGAETEDPHTSQQVRPDDGGGGFTCSCGSCSIINGRGAWGTLTVNALLRRRRQEPW